MIPGEDVVPSQSTELAEPAGTEPASGPGEMDVIGACQMWLALDFPDHSRDTMKETQ